MEDVKKMEDGEKRRGRKGGWMYDVEKLEDRRYREDGRKTM